MRRILAAASNVFDVRPGEGRAVILTFLYVALAVAGFLLAKPIRNGLFLGQYGAYSLVYAYVAVPLVLTATLPLYGLISERVGSRAVITGSLVFFGLNVLWFWWAFRFQGNSLAGVFYVWVNCFGVVVPVQAWTFASSVFDARQARRLFGLIGAGASAGAIGGGLLARELARRIGTVNLLLVLAVLIFLAAVVVNLAWSERKTSPRRKERRRALRLPAAFGVVRRSRYLTALALMVFLVAIITQWTGFQFSLIASQRYAGDTDRLTRLFGTFNLGMGSAAFIIQLAATGPALRRFGVGVTVLLLPIALLFGSVLTMAMPFFFAVVLTNAFDQGLRFSIDKATFELLYLPLPSHVKSGVKGVIDVLVSRVGDGVGGLLLGLATQGFAVGMIAIPGLGLGLRGLATCCAVGCAVWVGLALVLRRGYVTAITDSLQQYRLDLERAATASMDRSASAVLAKAFDAGDPEAILYVLRAFAQSGRRPPLDAVRALLTHETPAVRARALAALRAAPDLTIRAEAERLLHDPDIEVRTEALLWLAYHAQVDPLAQIDALGDFADFSIRASMVALYSRPGRYQNLEAARVLLGTMASERGPEGRRSRIEVAMLLGRLSADVGAELADLASLVADEDPEVASHAVAAAAKASRVDLVPAIATRLEDDAVRRAAHDALSAFGPPALPALAQLLDEPRVPLALRREIPDIVARIGTEAGSRLLVHHLLEADVTLRLRVIGALATLRARHPGLPLDLAAIEMVLMAEVMGHYRSYQILGSLTNPLQSTDPVAVALETSMRYEIERIFRLMAIRWPRFDVESAYVGVMAEDAAVRANALEFLDAVLKPQVRTLVLPLLDPQVSRAERVRLANEVLGTRVESHEDAVSALLRSEDPWLRSCGVYAVGALRLQQLAGELDRVEVGGDSLLRETVRQARARLAGEDAPAPEPPEPVVAEAPHVHQTWAQSADEMGLG
ncbi:MAG TPA: Npt1/Npt2 family nucleotide transporter [Vicinamibacterales bacterium]|nr:Npt1/Npt2 family nucleotide transporter [Vicinamibacterales bacterium]